jgi:hypothetical protein
MHALNLVDDTSVGKQGIEQSINLFAVVGTHRCEDYWCSNPHTWRLNTSRISRGYLEAGSISIKRCAIVGGDRRF